MSRTAPMIALVLAGALAAVPPALAGALDANDAQALRPALTDPVVTGSVRTVPPRTGTDRVVGEQPAAGKESSWPSAPVNPSFGF